MPIDPADRQWIEGELGHLFVAAQQLSLKLTITTERIKQADDRNKLLWGVCSVLILAFVAGLSTHFYWGGSVDTTLKSQSRQIDDLQASVRALTKEVQEHERRASTPKPEPIK